VSLLGGYFDDSRNANILTIAGYVAAAEHWDNTFVPEWTRFRDDPSWPSRMSEYKASDCRCGHSEFKSWQYAERDRCTRRAVQTIGAAFPRGEIVGIGIGVEMPPEWKDQPLERQFLSLAYLLCFGIIIRNVLQVRTLQGIEPKGDVRFVFDKQRKLEGVAREMFSEAIGLGGVEAQGLQDPSFEHSHDVMPLQAADLFAYETFKEIKNRRDEPTRAPSRALCALLESQHHMGFRVRADTIRMLLERRVRGKSTHTDEIPSLLIFQSGRPLRGDIP
jgi:hypothetical protein